MTARHEPFGCRWCGIPRPHGQQYLTGVGLHGWERPTDAQILARMTARRAVRTLTRFTTPGGTR